MIPTLSPDINYINHLVSMKHTHKQELTIHGTFMLLLPYKKEDFHEPFIELPIEYVHSLIKSHQIISYKTQCSCGEMVIETFENLPGEPQNCEDSESPPHET